MFVSFPRLRFGTEPQFVVVWFVSLDSNCLKADRCTEWVCCNIRDTRLSDSEVLNCVLHSADVSNPCRAWDVTHVAASDLKAHSLQWANHYQFSHQTLYLSKLESIYLYHSSASNRCLLKDWAMVCLEEFFAQGDQEKLLGIPAGSPVRAVSAPVR